MERKDCSRSAKGVLGRWERRGSLRRQQPAQRDRSKLFLRKPVKGGKEREGFHI